MPRTKSAKKQLRHSKARYEENRKQRSRVRTAVKAARAATGDEAAAKLREAERLLDRAGRKNLVHRNKAARLKRRLAKRAD